jgi:hypothetical protein
MPYEDYNSSLQHSDETLPVYDRRVSCRTALQNIYSDEDLDVENIHEVENMYDEPIEHIVAKDIHGILSNLPPKYNDIYIVIVAVVVTELVSFFLILSIHNFSDYLFS